MTFVRQAFMTVKGSLENIIIFHTDRGNEFKNQLIQETLKAFDITRSLSHKGCPYDNALAEATFIIVKTEFVKNQTFANLDVLKLPKIDSTVSFIPPIVNMKRYYIRMSYIV